MELFLFLYEIKLYYINYKTRIVKLSKSYYANIQIYQINFHSYIPENLNRKNQGVINEFCLAHVKINILKDLYEILFHLKVARKLHQQNILYLE